MLQEFSKDNCNGNILVKIIIIEILQNLLLQRNMSRAKNIYVELRNTQEKFSYQIIQMLFEKQNFNYNNIFFIKRLIYLKKGDTIDIVIKKFFIDMQISPNQRII